jgi:hypothetical protein
LKPADDIIQEMTGKPFSLKAFIKDNIFGILVSIIFHLIILIVFLIIKIDSFNEMKELGVVLDFTHERDLTEDQSHLSPDELAQIALYERLLERALRSSNEPVNVSRELEERISTENYVQEIEKQLEDLRSEEERRRLEEMNELLAAGIQVPEKPAEDLKHAPPYQGPTRISYEFHEPPYDRYVTHLPVPIYKCQSEGIIEVEIVVDASGNVSSAKPVIIGSPSDAECLVEAAVKYALLAKFTRVSGNPARHKGKIRYSFAAQ